MKISVGSLVTAPKTMYLDDPVAETSMGLEFHRGEIGLVVSVSPCRMSGGFWVKILTPRGMGICLDGELMQVV
jgi:hypothetical protein